MNYYEFNTPAPNRAPVKAVREIRTEFAANRAMVKSVKVKN